MPLAPALGAGAAGLAPRAGLHRLLGSLSAGRLTRRWCRRASTRASTRPVARAAARPTTLSASTTRSGSVWPGLCERRSRSASQRSCIRGHARELPAAVPAPLQYPDGTGNSYEPTTLLKLLPKGLNTDTLFLTCEGRFRALVAATSVARKNL